MICQLRAALHEYYPVVLEAFEDWTLRSAWAVVEALLTPEALAKSGKRKWEKFRHTHELYRPETYRGRLDLFARAETFCGDRATTNAKSMLAVPQGRHGGKGRGKVGRSCLSRLARLATIAA